MPTSPAINAAAGTSPRPGQGSKAQRPLNPNSKYPVRLADRLREENKEPEYANMRLEVDSSIKFHDPSAKVTITPASTGSEALVMTINNTTDGIKQQYKGRLGTQDTLYSLTFDQSSQSFILDRLDLSVSFSAEKPAASDSEGSDSDDDSVGTPDPDNPYDWRHYYKPDAGDHDDNDSVLSGVDSRSGSPVRYGGVRKASTPPGSIRGSPMIRGFSQNTQASTPARVSDVEQDAKPEDDSGDNDDGGFELILDGETTQHKPSTNRRPTRVDAAPRSLASMANSRNTSRQPAPGKSDRNADTDVINFDDDDGATSPLRSPAQNFEDKDVSEVDVGSPAHRPVSPPLVEFDFDPSPPPASPPPGPTRAPTSTLSSQRKSKAASPEPETASLPHPPTSVSAAANAPAHPDPDDADGSDFEAEALEAVFQQSDDEVSEEE